MDCVSETIIVYLSKNKLQEFSGEMLILGAVEDSSSCLPTSEMTQLLCLLVMFSYK